MGDSTCLMHGFSYASAIPNESKKGNPMHVLGESISFGRFATEPLSWDRWSAFSSHKKYVEEAQRFAQPGSVAQKKAFFEAHYKKIAAQRAAALLEQQNAAAANDDDDDDLSVGALLNPAEKDEDKVLKEQDIVEGKEDSNSAAERGNNNLVVKKEESIEHNLPESLENHETISGSDGAATPKLEERPLLKNCASSEDVQSAATSKKKSGLSSLKSSIQRKTWKVPSTPANTNPISPPFKNSMDKNRSSPKSLQRLINSTPLREPDKEPVKETAGLVVPSSSRTPKNCRTPWRTPVKATVNGVSKYSSTATPISENTRMKTPVDSSARGSKTNGPKWHILSAVCTKSLTACRNKLQSPTLSTPFVLRTEERAAKRKQKLEEKFNENEMQKVQQQQKQQVQQKTLKEKAGDEFRKLSCTFCFKARPLPDFYKEREMSIINQMKKAPAPAAGRRPQPTVLGKTISNKKQGSATSVPPSAPPFPSSLAKNSGGGGVSESSMLKRINPNPNRVLSLRTALENRSPNIQH
ncbi:protein WVD2-like 7 isoform X2 [Andrographis paniculata]|uniref:protein WVD2-like 7 isoform X2 n=1 Tax=Andrographis paniculata TaxID=175694 RepID=UPI0021E8290C|nr:protein WVD2-like 7 isoform X2 [Andrographis paniculata]